MLKWPIDKRARSSRGGRGAALVFYQSGQPCGHGHYYTSDSITAWRSVGIALHASQPGVCHGGEGIGSLECWTSIASADEVPP